MFTLNIGIRKKDVSDFDHGMYVVARWSGLIVSDFANLLGC